MHAQDSKKTNRTILLILTALAAVGLRVWNLNLPFVEPYNSIARQSIVASVARNFYENGFNFSYPEINENGRGPYLYNAEMPFYSYAMALGYKMMGGVKEGAARAVSVGFSLLTLLFVYLSAKRIFLKETSALVALLFISFSPLYLAISRSIQPESAFLAGLMGALYFFQRYLDKEELLSFWLSAIFLSFAVATKFFNAYLLVLIVYMAWRAKGFSIFCDLKNYLYIIVVCLSFVWYWYMWKLGLEMNLAYYPYRYLGNKAGAATSAAEIILFWPAIIQCLKIFFIHILTPVGSILFFAGFLKKPKREEDTFLVVWFVITLVTLIVGWKTVAQHSYYQIPLVLPAAFFVARGYEALRLDRKSIVATLVLAAGVFCASYFYKGLYFIPERRMAIIRAGEETDRLIPKTSLLVASHETSAIQLYYAHRRGWQFSLIGRGSEALIKELEAHRREGAEFFLATALDDLKKVSGFENYLRRQYKVLKETVDFVLFDLRA